LRPLCSDKISAPFFSQTEIPYPCGPPPLSLSWSPLLMFPRAFLSFSLHRNAALRNTPRLSRGTLFSAPRLSAFFLPTVVKLSVVFASDAYKRPRRSPCASPAGASRFVSRAPVCLWTKASRCLHPPQKAPCQSSACPPPSFFFAPARFLF